MFEPVSSRVSFPEIDASVLQLWKDKDVFARASEERMESPSFMLYEGPPPLMVAQGSTTYWLVCLRMSYADTVL